jgi:hypothetical protein
MAHPEVDLTAVRTVSVRARARRVRIEQLASPVPGGSLGEFLASLPDVLAAHDLRDLVSAIVAARRAGRGVLVMLGGHVVKVGVVPCLLTLARRGLITAFALNGAAAIHDVELALFGETSEDVQAALLDGTFGMADETGRFINETIADGCARGEGFGESVGRAVREACAPHAALSLLATAHELGLPATVHVAIGTDIVHQHPTARGEDLGAASLRDFRILAHQVTTLDHGVALNLGSAVVLPEVFLKAVAVARNLGHPVAALFAANLDMIQHYRPLRNVVERPTAGDGHGITLTGHHEIMVPLLTGMVLAAWDAPSRNSPRTTLTGW